MLSSSKRRLVRMLGTPTQCYLCGGPLRLEEATADHVNPKVRGGTDLPHNRRWTHRECNQIKGALLVPELLVRLEQILQHLSR